jgi:predicted glycosyltransferase
MNTTVIMNSTVIDEVIPRQTIQGAESSEPSPIVPVGGSDRAARRTTIWIDIDNSPHVPFFLPIIEELKKRGIDVELTARDMYQVCELLEFFKLPCKVIGGHYGKNKVLKVLGSCLRVLQLVPTAAKLRPNLALSHGSRAQILVCKALGIPTVMLHDYEHSTKTGFIAPDWTLTPAVITDGAMSRRPERSLKYPGLKEDVYIPSFRPDPSILSHLGISRDSLVVTLRPPATEAHYHNPESEELFAEALRLLAERPNVRAVTLPRNARQSSQLRKEWAHLIAAGNMIIPEGPVDGLNLIWFSDLVISGGGTMNREAGALGVPVYSIFRGKIGAVDRYLADNGRLTLLENAKDVRTKIKLARWNRPTQPDSNGRPALQSIVNQIVEILEGKCQAAQRLI